MLKLRGINVIYVKFCHNFSCKDYYIVLAYIKEKMFDHKRGTTGLLTVPLLLFYSNKCETYYGSVGVSHQPTDHIKCIKIAIKFNFKPQL